MSFWFVFFCSFLLVSFTVAANKRNKINLQTFLFAHSLARICRHHDGPLVYKLPLRQCYTMPQETVSFVSNVYVMCAHFAVIGRTQSRMEFIFLSDRNSDALERLIYLGAMFMIRSEYDNDDNDFEVGRRCAATNGQILSLVEPWNDHISKCVSCFSSLNFANVTCKSAHRHKFANTRKWHFLYIYFFGCFLHKRFYV